MNVTRGLAALCLYFCIPALYAQEAPVNKRGMFSYGVSMSDFNFQNDLKHAAAPKPSFGVQFAYWEPLVSHIDLSCNLGLVYSHLPARFVKSDSTGQDGITVNSEVLIHLKAFARDAKVNPFLTAGIGGGSFGYQPAFYAPLGAGVAFRFNSGSIIILQGQMRQALERNVTGNFMFYSASFAHDLTGTRQKKHKNRKDEVLNDALSSADKNKTNASAKSSSTDSDGDGIPDKYDKCPQIKGSIENDGCPFPLLQGADVATMSADSVTYRIYFEFDRSELVGQAFGALNRIMKILQADKTLTISISGYADMQGTEARNIKISADRAIVTRNYFLSYNIAASRIATSYYGASNPVDKVHQWKNRRAEITVIKH